MCEETLIEYVRRLARKLREYPRALVDEELDKLGPEKHLVRYIMEVVD